MRRRLIPGSSRPGPRSTASARGEFRPHGVAERVARGILPAVAEREHAGLGNGDRDRQGDARRGDEREPPGADAQGCDSREHDGTGGVIGAADHHDPPACVLGASGRGERPLAQHPVVDPGRLTPA